MWFWFCWVWCGICWFWCGDWYGWWILGCCCVSSGLDYWCDIRCGCYVWWSVLWLVWDGYGNFGWFCDWIFIIYWLFNWGSCCCCWLLFGRCCWEMGCCMVLRFSLVVDWLCFGFWKWLCGLWFWWFYLILWIVCLVFVFVGGGLGWDVFSCCWWLLFVVMIVGFCWFWVVCLISLVWNLMLWFCKCW